MTAPKTLLTTLCVAFLLFLAAVVPAPKMTITDRLVIFLLEIALFVALFSSVKEIYSPQ